MNIPLRSAASSRRRLFPLLGGACAVLLSLWVLVGPRLRERPVVSTLGDDPSCGVVPARVVGTYRCTRAGVGEIEETVEFRADGTFRQQATYNDGSVRRSSGRWKLARLPYQKIVVTYGVQNVSGRGPVGPRSGGDGFGIGFSIRSNGRDVTGLYYGETDERQFERVARP